MKGQKISTATIKRLPIYLRHIVRMKEFGLDRLSSQEIGDALNFSAAQVRKDLSIFGEFGKKGFGYDITTLANEIENILNLNQTIPVCLIGAGKLGEALINYNHYKKNNMLITSVFDNSPKKIGKEILSIPIQCETEMKDTILEKGIKIGIICVPDQAAQSVADLLVDSGVKAILNFAPIKIKTTEDVTVHYADFTTELYSLAFFLK